MENIGVHWVQILEFVGLSSMVVWGDVSIASGIFCRKTSQTGVIGSVLGAFHLICNRGEGRGKYTFVAWEISQGVMETAWLVGVVLQLHAG